MFIRLLVTSLLSIAVVQSVVTNSSKGQNADALTLPKQATLYDDYDLNDQKTPGNHVEGSGGAASLDEYADDEEEEQLSKVTATTVTTSILTTKTTSTTTTTTTITTTTTTTTTTRRITTSSTTVTATQPTMPSFNKWLKTTLKYGQIYKKNQNNTTLSTALDDFDANEFKDDQEEYADDLENDSYYNEPTISNKLTVTPFLPTRYSAPVTRLSSTMQNPTHIWILFSFLTRPPIAAGILAGLAIGILTSIILLICIIRRCNKREKCHSSYTTGLLYPNQYGYSKSPQEFYA